MNNTIVKLDPANCFAHPLNRIPRDGHIKELMTSINLGGQITPILVRPHPTIEKAYEIAAGVCRSHACKRLKIYVDAIVRDMDNSEIEEILIVENLQREDLDPYEEADKLAQLVERGHDVAQFAAGLGKTTAWLKSRMRLTNLDKTVGKAVKGRWPLELVEAISDYPAITQKIILDRYSYRSPQGIKDIREAGKGAAIRVDNVTWLSDPKTANGKCGAGGCSTTDGDMLFHEKGKCVNCMNPDCFRKRHAKHLNLLVTEMLALYPGRVVLRDDVYRLMNDQLGSVPKGVKKVENWIARKEFGSEVKTPDDNSFAMVELNKDRNSVVWFYNAPEAKAGKGKASAAAGSPVEDARPDRVSILKGKRFMGLLNVLVNEVRAYRFGPNINHLIAAFGTCTNWNRDEYHTEDRWALANKGSGFNLNFLDRNDDGEPLLFDARTAVAEMVRRQIIKRLSTNLNPTRAAQDKKLIEEMNYVADWLKVDLEKERLAIAAEFPPSKSWIDEVDPITLEPKKK